VILRPAATWKSPITKSAADSADARLGSYPIVTSQYSPAALYQASYHIQHLFF
jgi:hypothetical protein